MKKIILLISFLLAGSLLLTSCSSKQLETGEDTVSRSEKASEFMTSGVLRSFESMQGWFNPCGRAVISGENLICDYPCSGFEMTVNSSETEFNLTYSVSSSTYFTLYIDGKEDSRLALSGENTVLLAYLSEGTHTIKLLRDEETKAGDESILKWVTFTGTVAEPPSQKALYIEFIGDSIVSGNGALTADNSPGATWKAGECSATNAFGYLTAQKLDADLSVVGRGSIGLVKKVKDSTGKEFAMPTLYKYATGLSSERRLEYDFSSVRVPDLIVLEVSTNDRASSVSDSQFSSAAKKFLPEIRSLWGRDIPIVWVYNLMTPDEHESVLLKTVESLGGEENGYYTLKLEQGQNGGRGTVDGNCHPSVDDHAKNAEILSEFIKGIIK